LWKKLKKDHLKWIKTRGAQYIDFAWQREYGAFSMGQSAYNDLRKYRQTQEEPHKDRCKKRI